MQEFPDNGSGLERCGLFGVPVLLKELFIVRHRNLSSVIFMRAVGENEALDFVKKHGVPIVKKEFVKDADSAVNASKKLGFPVVMKISSPQVLHKTDVGGVITDIRDEEHARESFVSLVSKVKKKVKGAKIEGVVIEQQLKGHEVIIGAKKDDQFGPVIMFGLGGVFVEVFKDVSFRIVPIDRSDAKEMITELKAHPILAGARGGGAVNFKALEDMLLKVSKMLWKRKDIAELDLNPVFVDGKTAVAADARMVLE